MLPSASDSGSQRAEEEPSPLECLLAADTLPGPPPPRVRPRAPVPTAARPAPPERIGRYLVRGMLGEGSVGAVYRAWDDAAGREVAVKVLNARAATDARMIEPFRRDPAACRRLRHAALVDLLEAGPDHLVAELVEGESLAARLQRGPMAPEEALALLGAVAAGVDHVHACGVVHGDVKPSNVLLPRVGGAKLADLGIAVRGWLPQRRGGVVVGSPAYMAPERLSRDLVHPAGDLYALAAVAYETLTGVLPLRRASLGALLLGIVTDEPPPASATNPSLSAAVDEVLAKGLAKAPEKRYAVGRAFVAALGAALGRVPSLHS